MPTVENGERAAKPVWDMAISMGFGFRADIHTNCYNPGYFPCAIFVMMWG